MVESTNEKEEFILLIIWLFLCSVAGVGQVERNTVLFLVFQTKDLQWKALPVASHSQRAINQIHLISPLYLSHKEMTRLETWAPATTPALTNFCYNILWFTTAKFYQTLYSKTSVFRPSERSSASELTFQAGMYCSVVLHNRLEYMNMKVAGWITCPFGFLCRFWWKSRP